MSSSRAKPHVAPYAGPPWPVAAAWLAAALLAQSTLAHLVAVRGIAPSFVLLVVAWYAVRADAFRAAAYGLAAGLGEDVLAGQTGGAWTVSTVTTALAIGVLSRGFFADSIPIVTATTAIATLLRWLIFWVTMSLQGYPGGLGAMHAHEAFAQAILNALVMLAVMLVARRLDSHRA